MRTDYISIELSNWVDMKIIFMFIRRVYQIIKQEKSVKCFSNLLLLVSMELCAENVYKSKKKTRDSGFKKKKRRTGSIIIISGCVRARMCVYVCAVIQIGKMFAALRNTIVMATHTLYDLLVFFSSLFLSVRLNYCAATINF